GRHGGGQRLGARARKRGGDRDRREDDVREMAQGQEPEAHDPEEQDGGHEERRQDRPSDEEFGAHEVLGGLISTFAPGTSRSWPSVTTRSPARRPCSMMVSAPRRVPGATGRDSTVASGFTTKTNGPCWPGWIACDGTTIAVRLVHVSTTSRNWPGQSALSVFENVALSCIVAVGWSTALFPNVSSPAAIGPRISVYPSRSLALSTLACAARSEAFAFSTAARSACTVASIAARFVWS